MGRRSVEKLVLEGLEVGKYFALDENKVMLSPNGYLSIREFCRDLDPNKFAERRNLRFGAPNFSWAVGP